MGKWKQILERTKDKDKDLTHKEKDKGLTHKDKDKDLTPKDQNKNKDLKYVLKESLRTRTRINITVFKWSAKVRKRFVICVKMK